MEENEWEYEECSISKIEKLISEGYEIEVDTPDGFQGVSAFVHKGDHKGYEVKCNNRKLRVSRDHLFETEKGWKFVHQIINGDYKVLCDDGQYHKMDIVETDEYIPIVDITVKHKNSRYYTDGVSSHNSGGGKSIFLCHYAASCLKQNLNVLYITCEMAEERIAERIDANLIDVELSNIKYMTKSAFMAKINKVQSSYKGKLIIKEYPTSSANALNFRHLLEELKTKKKFLPDVIIVDYLNICESYKFKKNTSANSYTLVKSVAEELRAIAQDFDVPILTAAQFNREGAASTDPGQENVAESAGLNHTADLMFAIVTTDELEAYQQVMIKQLKNRYSDISRNRKFLLGLDKPKMRFYNINNSVNTTFTQPPPTQNSPGNNTQQKKPTPAAPKLFSGGTVAPVKKEEEYTHKNIFTGKQVSSEFNQWN